MRARLALAVSRQRCRLREVVLRNKPASLLEASSKGTIPVLVLSNGQAIEESLDIMLWALRQNDPEGWLSPPGSTLAALMELIEENDGPFKHQLDRYKYPNRFDLDSGAPARDAACAWLATFDERLSAHGGWLMGGRRSLADMAIAPFIRQFAHTDRTWFQAQPWPALQAWLAAFLDDPLFTGVMHKYAPWEPGQPEPVFIEP